MHDFISSSGHNVSFDSFYIEVSNYCEKVEYFSYKHKLMFDVCVALQNIYEVCIATVFKCIVFFNVYWKRKLS